jgi:hypothetical protein
VWTNFLAHTNGRSLALWSTWEKPPGFPLKAPIMAWNTNCVAWGMRGLTAISQSWEDEGGKGQAPVTALTRRHGYLRGHDMGPDGFTTNRNGKRIWFVTRDNKMIEVRVQSAVVRIGGAKHRDYTILLFDHDLPPGIEPLRVVSRTNLVSHYALRPDIPRPYFQTEQGGNISTSIRGFSVNTMKGGDSGSPDMVPMPGELIFAGGRTTSPASQDMQEDINELCLRAHLDPHRYQLQWVDWSKYPEY